MCLRHKLTALKSLTVIVMFESPPSRCPRFFSSTAFPRTREDHLYRHTKLWSTSKYEAVN